MSLETEHNEVLAPPGYRWPGGSRLAVTFLVAYEGWSDGKAPGIGPMGNPLPAGTVDTNALSWGNYGARRGIWRILKVLEKLDLHASIMVCGVLAERHPETIRAIAAGGHEIIAHSYAMDVLPVLLDERQERENIKRTTDLIESACGVRPIGWISPRLTPSANTGRLLAQAGYIWHGDTLADDLPSLARYGRDALVNIPFTMEVNDLPLAMRYGNPPSQMVDVFRTTLDALKRQEDETGKVDVTIHAHAFGRPAGIWTYEAIANIAKSEPDVFLGLRHEIATHFKSLFTPDASNSASPVRMGKHSPSANT
ncbi:MAG: polysaccharide deacetylase [Burkholderiaceae bacterium]|nr:MAG: polysaccharide deacetylase [Burkholderiaceae bacterium]